MALFGSYAEAHRSAQRLIQEGLPARVTYLLEETGQEADGREGFYPKLEREDRVPSGLESPGRRVPLSGSKYALAGTDSLVVSPTLEERLREIGLEDDQLHRLLDRVAAGYVAAVFRMEGPAERAMALLAINGAKALEQV